MEHLIPTLSHHLVSEKMVELQIVIDPWPSEIVDIESSIIVGFGQRIFLVRSVGIDDWVSIDLGNSLRLVFLPGVCDLGHGSVVLFLICFSQEVDWLRFILSCSQVSLFRELALLVEGLFGRILSKRIVVQRTKQFFDIDFCKIFNIVARANMVAEIDSIFRFNIVLLTSRRTSLEETVQTLTTCYCPLEKFYEFQLIQIFILLDLSSDVLGHRCQFDIQCQQL